VKGTPLTWALGRVDYYTDQGSLSPYVSHAGADALVNAALDRWISVNYAALFANLAGQLSEDVNGSNVTGTPPDPTIMPLDIMPSAINKPLAFVYDFDGAVTDALLGAGAGSSAGCFTNAVFGGPDNFSADGHIVHALVVINGNCAQDATQVFEVQYRLDRVVGRVLGLDWSQLNWQLVGGTPVLTPADYLGLPLMHPTDPISCIPITLCNPMPDALRMDDRAAISRLYPVTVQNQSNFPGKHPFAVNTARLRGSVRFSDAYGNPAQPMQGVNVVARWIDPASNTPSRQWVASSVSGFLFRGNAGNAVTGYADPTGQAWDRFGSDDTGVEGFFDLAGLEFPNGGNTAQYEISVEAIDPVWSQAVGPYGPWQVRPAGAWQPVRITVNRGDDLAFDILMAGSAGLATDGREPESFDAPASVPAAGDWAGSFSGYGDADFFWFRGQANRTLSVEVEATDDTSSASSAKARPVIGIWALSASSGTPPPAATSTAFNTFNPGLSRLDAVLLASTDFRLGIADERGDGRPDYRYRARILYGDRVTPARVGVAGGAIVAIDGMGFRPGAVISVGTTNVGVASLVSHRIFVALPPKIDGVQSVAIQDPLTGGSSILTDVLTYGAGQNDSIVLLSGANPTTRVGAEAANPVRVRVLGAGSGSPVFGASVVLSASPAAGLSACGSAAGCTVLTDEYGEVSTRVTPQVTGSTTVTATLAPASYSNPKYVQATVPVSSSTLDIAVLAAYRWLAQNASVDTALTARVLNNGSPVSGRTVNFQVLVGTAALTSTSAVTDAAGNASTAVQIRNLAGDIRVSACVAPGNAPCDFLWISKVAPSDIQLHAVAGSDQLVGVGSSFQPVVVRVTDSAAVPNPVEGATVNFALTEMRADYDSYTGEVDDDTGGRTGMPVILGWRQVAVQSDVAGLAGINPTPTASGAVEIEIMATAGTAAVQQTEVESMWMITSNWGSNSPAPGGQFAPAGSPVAGPRSSRSLTPLVPRRPRSDRNLQ
jgi:IPT/TIG domain-containing protein